MKPDLYASSEVAVHDYKNKVSLVLTSVQLCKVSNDTTRASECKVKSGSASVLEHRFSISGICGL